MRKYRFLWLLVFVDVLFVAAIWFDLTPLVRGPAEWRWNLRESQVPAWQILIPGVALAAYVWAAVRWLTALTREAAESRSRRLERSFLVFLTLAAPLVQVALATAVWRSPLFEFFANTVSPSVTGFHSVAVTTPNLLDHLEHYSQFMPSLPIHPQTHPPGIVLFQWLGWQVFASLKTVADAVAMPLRTLQCHNVALMTLDNAQLASATLGMLIPAVGGLTVWPLYALGKRIIGAQRAALAAALFPILPMFAMWPSQWDQVFPLFMLTGLYLVHIGLERSSSRWIFLAGVVFSAATFLSVGNAIMIVIAGLYGLVWWLTRMIPRDLVRWSNIKRWAKQVVALGVGSLSVWALYAVIYQVDVNELVATISNLALESTRCPICPSTTRTYSVWVLWDVIDFGVFLSLPLVLALLYRLPMLMKAAVESVRRQQTVVWGPLAVAALTTFVLLDVAGIVRGETSRLWAYFGPLMLLLALVPDTRPPWPITRWAPIVASLVAVQLLVMNIRWQPYLSFMDEPPLRAASFTSPQPQTENHLVFGRNLELVGYDYTSSAASVDLNLYWEALAQPAQSYTVFVHVLDANGQLIAQQDRVPVAGQLPTSCWQPNEYVTDPYSIALPPNAGDALTVEIGLYRVDTGERLTRADGQGTALQISLPASKF